MKQPNPLQMLSFYLRVKYYEFLMWIGFWNPYTMLFKVEMLLKKYGEYIAHFPEFQDYLEGNQKQP